MMVFLKRLGIDAYMLLLLGTVCLGLWLPVQGNAAAALKQLTFWAVALLFFLHGAQLDPAALRAGLKDWKLQGLTLAATYVVLPLLGLALALLAGPSLGPTVTIGLLFLSVLPSTVNSAIAFTSVAGGNLPAAICAATLSNLLGVLLTPALLAVLLHQSGGAVQTDAVLKIGSQILLPFALGQLTRPWIGALVMRYKLPVRLVDRGSILLIVYSAFSAGTVAGLWAAIPPVQLIELILVVGVFVTGSMGLMIVAGRLPGLGFPDRAMLFYCGSGKSLASGLPIATALFAADDLGAIVLPVMIYHLVQLTACAFVSQKTARYRQKPLAL